jgi:hypothetical protein
MNLEILIVNLIMWLIGLYLLGVLFFKLKSIMGPILHKILGAKVFRVIRIYYLCSWDFLLLKYSEKLENYKNFYPYKILIQKIILVYIPTLIFILCILEIKFIFFFGIVFLVLKLLLFFLVLSIFFSILFVSQSWELMKNNVGGLQYVSSIKVCFISIYYCCFYAIYFLFELVVLTFKMILVGCTRYLANILAITLSVGALFEAIYLIQTETMVYTNFSFGFSACGLVIFFILFIILNLFVSSIFEPMYINGLKKHKMGKYLREREWKIFRFTFFILTFILGCYLLTAYEYDYIFSHGGEVASRDIFTWSSDINCDCGRHNNYYNITISDEPLNYKKFKGYGWFAFALLILTFIIHNIVIIFMHNKNKT